MNRMITWIAALAILFVCVAPVTGQLQDNGVYVVSEGDTLWTLSEVYRDDPLLWREVVVENPFLDEPGRQFVNQNGDFVVLVKPGEELRGLGELGIVPSPTKINTFSTVITEPGSLPWWMLLLAVIGALALTALGYWVYRDHFGWKHKDPVTSGEPVWTGGVRYEGVDGTYRRAATRFRQMAQARMLELNPEASPIDDRPELVGAIEHGRISGVGLVRYRDQAPQRRQMSNESAYRATFRFPDGREEQLFFLEACANDVIFGGVRYENFEFTAGKELHAPEEPESIEERPRPRAEETRFIEIEVGNDVLRAEVDQGSSVLDLRSSKPGAHRGHVTFHANGKIVQVSPGTHVLVEGATKLRVTPTTASERIDIGSTSIRDSSAQAETA